MAGTGTGEAEARGTVRARQGVQHARCRTAGGPWTVPVQAEHQPSRSYRRVPRGGTLQPGLRWCHFGLERPGGRQGLRRQRSSPLRDGCQAGASRSGGAVHPRQHARAGAGTRGAHQHCRGTRHGPGRGQVHPRHGHQRGHPQEVRAVLQGQGSCRCRGTGPVVAAHLQPAGDGRDGRGQGHGHCPAPGRPRLAGSARGLARQERPGRQEVRRGRRVRDGCRDGQYAPGGHGRRSARPVLQHVPAAGKPVLAAGRTEGAHPQRDVALCQRLRRPGQQAKGRRGRPGGGQRPQRRGEPSHG